MAMATSTSDDSASFASTMSRRRRPSPAIVASSSVSDADTAPSTASSTWARMARSRSMPPRRSMPCGVPRSSKPPSVDLAEHGGVERAAAEVVDGDDRPRLHPLAAGPRHRGRLRLGAQEHRTDGGVLDRLAQQVELERAPVGRVGDGDAGRRSALALDDPVDDRAEEPGGEELGGERRRPDEHRRRIADAALELPGDPSRLLERPAAPRPPRRGRCRRRAGTAPTGRPRRGRRGSPPRPDRRGGRRRTCTSCRGRRRGRSHRSCTLRSSHDRLLRPWCGSRAPPGPRR